MTAPKRYPRGRNVHSVVRQLMDEGILRDRPRQVDRGEHSLSDGVDIVYDLTRMSPDRFARHIDQLLVAAAYEANRYEEFDYFFGSFSVRLNTGATRRSQENTRVYTAAMSSDIDNFIWGDGTDNPVELGGQGRSLSHKAEAIINMLQSGSPGAYVNQQSPYTVLRMVISVRLRAGGAADIPTGEVNSGITRVTRPNA